MVISSKTTLYIPNPSEQIGCRFDIMPGLYFHIPFCRKACTYCDFHFSTSTQSTERALNAMLLEVDQWSASSCN